MPQVLWVSTRVDSNLSLDFPAYANFSFVEFNIEVTPNHILDNIYLRDMKRLTDGMKNEMVTINHRVNTFNAQFVANVPIEQHSHALSCFNSQHGDELETYKVRLENFYSETDVKE